MRLPLRPTIEVAGAVMVLSWLFLTADREPKRETAAEVGGDPIDAEPFPTPTEVVRSASAHDFQVVVTTVACTTVSWSWRGPLEGGESLDGSIEDEERCTTTHILSPPVQVRLVPDSTFEIEALFTTDDGVQSSFAATVATTAEDS